MCLISILFGLLQLKSDVNQLHNVGSEPTPDKNTAASTPSSLPATARDNGSNKERREEMTMTIDEDSMDADTVSNNTSATTTNAVSSNARENSLPRDVVVADLKAELKYAGFLYFCFELMTLYSKYIINVIN